MLLSLVVASACLVGLIKDRNALRAVLLLSAGLVSVYLARNLLAWGTVMPPGASRAPFLRSYMDLYAYGLDHPTLTSATERILEPKYIIDRFTVGARALLEGAFVPGRIVWYPLGVAGGLTWLRRRRWFEMVVWLLAFPTVGALTWAAGTVFAPYRTLHTLLPVIVLAGGYTLDHVSTCTATWARSGKAGAWRSTLTTSLTFSVCALLIHSTSLYSARLSPRVEMERTLASLDALLGGAPVASTRPWFVLADTSSPVVHLPENGEAAIEAVFEKYEIQWLLVQDRYGMFRGSRFVVEELMSGRRTTIGKFRITREASGPGVTVFRVAR